MASPDVPAPEDAASPDDADYSNGEEMNQDSVNMSSSDVLNDPQTAAGADDQPQRAESNGSVSEEQTPGKTTAGGKANSKDPSRPRRKKARRACFACQRAHLTCGDERPCQRCIKRGLQDACHDGVRKKAKYLHDAPAEALIPPGLGGYHHLNGTKAIPDAKQSIPMTPGSLAQASSYYAQAQPDLYSPGGHHQMPQTLQNAGNGTPFNNNSQTPISPHYAQNGQPTTPLTAVPQSSQSMQQFGGPLFDPSDPALFNLDIASLNFGNHYGALEFGMLDQMSSAAFGPDNPDLHNMPQVSGSYGPHGPQYASGNAMFVQDALMNADWAANNPRVNSPSGRLHTPNNTPIVTSLDRHELHGLPQGYAIGAGGPGSLASASPVSLPHEPPIPLDNPSSPALFLNPSQEPSPTFAKPALPQQSQAQAVQPPDSNKTSTAPGQTRKRAFDADYIYDHPPPAYSYRDGFHSLLSLVHKRFAPEKKLKIAKALAAVRPSLITFSQSISNKDRAFGEQALQRKLYEYRDFISAYGTPSIICRRDFNVVAASKEFHILTGWSKDVLLGKTPNLNVNTGIPPGQTPSANRSRQLSQELDKSELGNGSNGTGNGSNGTAGKNEIDSAPAIPIAAPVFLAELMCQDSVIQFYEDYAKLAFGDASGHACRRVNLLKYRTKEEDLSINSRLNEAAAENGTRRKSEGPQDAHSRKGSVETRLASGVIHHEADINRLGEKEGMVDCMMIWSVRRDVFEVPMLIVMNFLPVLS